MIGFWFFEDLFRNCSHDEMNHSIKKNKTSIDSIFEYKIALCIISVSFSLRITL